MIDQRLCPEKPADESEKLGKWLRKDKTARMTSGLTLSDKMLKNVSVTTTALEMWQDIYNLHQRHTLFNKLSARRDFYTATMREGESMLTFINRVREKAAKLESMSVKIDGKELAMAVLNGLMQRFGTIITALDAIGDADDSFTFDKVKSRLLQEEKRTTLRSASEDPGRPSALVETSSDIRKSSGRKYCTFCGRQNHTEATCWQKHGRPESSFEGRHGEISRVEAADIPPSAQSVIHSATDYICLMSKEVVANKADA